MHCNRIEVCCRNRVLVHETNRERQSNRIANSNRHLIKTQNRVRQFNVFRKLTILVDQPKTSSHSFECDYWWSS